MFSLLAFRSRFQILALVFVGNKRAEKGILYREDSLSFFFLFLFLVKSVMVCVVLYTLYFQTKNMQGQEREVNGLGQKKEKKSLSALT